MRWIEGTAAGGAGGIKEVIEEGTPFHSLTTCVLKPRVVHSNWSLLCTAYQTFVVGTGCTTRHPQYSQYSKVECINRVQRGKNTSNNRLVQLCMFDYVLLRLNVHLRSVWKRVQYTVELETDVVAKCWNRMMQVKV